MDDYIVYLRELADEIGCDLRMAPDMAGMMYVEFGYVEGPDPYASRVTQQQAFAVNLHELGHFEYGHTQGRPPKGDLKFYFDNGVLYSEAQAWDFALSHFWMRDEQIEDATRSYMWNTCMGSYYRGAVAANGQGGQRLWNGNRHHVAFAYDEPDDYFWSVKAAILGVAVLA